MAVAFWDEHFAGYEEYQHRNKNPWDILTLNETRVPGIAEVKVTPNMKIDIKKTTGFDGGPTIELGHQAAKLDIAITLWTPEQWTSMQALIASIWRLPGREDKSSSPRQRTRRAAVSISHPNCQLYGIAAILIEGPEGLVPAPGTPGAKVLRIRAVQYIPPPKGQPVTKKAAGAGDRAPLSPGVGSVLKSGIPRKSPSQTDAVALPGPGPAQGAT